MASSKETAQGAEKSAHDAQHVEHHIEDELKPTEVVIDAATKGQAVSGYEHLTLWETVKTFKIATLICFAAAFSAGNDGYQIGINASIVANKGFVRQFATKLDAKGQPYLESPILSGWGSIMSVGQVVGTISIAFISNRFGRKMSMYWLWIVLVASVLAESLARTWQVWLVAKLLAGIGVGSLQATIPPYISEVAPTRIRGGLLMLYTFWWTTGSFFAQIALFNINSNTPYNWLTPIYTQWGQIGVMAIIFFIIPETPAWYATHGHEEAAKKSLRWIHRDVPGYDEVHQYNILAMLVEHERAVAAEQRREKWWAIFQGIDGRRTLIAVWPYVGQQFIGLKLFSTFGTYFFQQAGVGNPFTVKCITSSIQIATILVNVMITDKFGRRPLASSAVTLAWISCIVVGILGVVPETSARTYVFVLFACFWNIGMVTTGAVGAGFLGEISSNRLRPYTAGFAMGASCVVGIIMDVLVPYMVNANQWNWSLKTGWFYAGLGLIATAGMWYLVPETAGRTAAELDELFEKKLPAWKFSKTETATERLVKQEAN
ncbi:unnamed protein product [Clonostachys rhizophaga]|uniref:Major facilitator superfamily (MFS) profile domain-containing protein n=1 Tax=Clonostachys rhizophaga TaxID=160324 RepID=A0A9N9VJE5_9HYPO|nr:unnamed protein product [Clonostachys rhizophaga]